MIARTMSALAEPHRLRMLERLRSGPQPVGVLASAARLEQPQASKHLRVLRDAGLVAVTPDGQRRLYALRGAPMQELDTWLQRFRANWDARFERLDQLLADNEEDDRED
ncbi:MAG: winged helix-turn-helix transcriptional regulator [Deltaproteobacteria bacterium]|nr:winged helix-turn-helix transcriptional regulator [Deltaproteobacteria bacterium]